MTVGRIAEFHHVPGTTLARLFNFDIAQDRLKPEHQAWLKKNVIGLLRNGGSLWIMGLTSTTGSESFNISLSQKRAGSVVAFLRGELSKDFSVKLEAGLGEMAARIAGLRDNTEDANWRAVVLGVWDKPVPPPPPPPPHLQEACKRTVIISSNGVAWYAYRGAGGGVIGQSPKVKASPDFIKCATDFERKWSFLDSDRSYPVVEEDLSVHDHISNPLIGEVVGHYMTINRHDIIAETATLRRLRPPNNSFRDLPVDVLFNGYGYTDVNQLDFVSLGFKVPLYVGDDGGAYSSIAYSSEGARSYTVITDIYGKILLLVSGQSSRYPKSETTLHVIVKTAVKKGIRMTLKNLWRLL